MPGRQSEEWQRHEHREPDEPEIERIAADGVHLPADRDERHLDGDGRRSGDAEKEDEVAVPERRILEPARSKCCGLRRLAFLVVLVGRREELHLETLDP